MKFYMRYILPKFAFIIVMTKVLTEYAQKYPPKMGKMG